MRTEIATCTQWSELRNIAGQISFKRLGSKFYVHTIVTGTTIWLLRINV